MGIFNEKVLSQKSAILTFIEQQKILAEVADELDKETSTTLPLQSIYEIPRKKSMMDVIEKFKLEAEESLSKSHEVDEKIEQLHGMVENVDKITYFGDVSHEKKKEAEKKNSESSLAKKRVHQLESGDSNASNNAYTKPIIKSLLDPPKKYRSRLTVVPKRSVTVLPPTPSSSTASLPPKFHRTPMPRNVRVSESVRKILDDFKEKRESKKSQKKPPVNVINLKLN